MKVSIDTIKAILIANEPIFDVEDNGVVISYDKNKKIVNGFGNRVSINGKHDTHSLNIRAVDSNRKLVVEGSYFAYLFGQNIFTSSNMKTLVAKTIKKLFKHRDLNLPDKYLDRFLNGDVELHRVDLAVNYDLETQENVVNVLRQIRRQLTERGPKTSTHLDSVMWSPCGADYSIVFYNKGNQINSASKYKNFEWKAILKNESDGALRVEVRLQRRILLKLKLSKASDWNLNTPDAVFKHFFAKLPVTSIASGPFDLAELKKLPGVLKHVWAVFRSGIPLKLVYTKRTLVRYRAALKKLGFDIDVDSFPDYTVLPLSALLEESKVMNVPEVFRKVGLFPPRQRIAREVHQPIKMKRTCSKF